MPNPNAAQSNDNRVIKLSEVKIVIPTQHDPGTKLSVESDRITFPNGTFYNAHTDHLHLVAVDHTSLRQDIFFEIRRRERSWWSRAGAWMLTNTIQADEVSGDITKLTRA